MSNEASRSVVQPADAYVLKPALALAQFGVDEGPMLRCAIPRNGFLLGRGAEIFDSPLTDEKLAPRHAEVRFEGERLLVRDLGSPGGTRLNGRPLVSEQPLAPGDVLRVGDTLLLITASSAPTPPSEVRLMGGSTAMSEVRHSIDRVAGRKHAVVVTGETGTGKEEVGRLLHEHSHRTGPFLAVNCGTFTEGLLASDLFGHVRGAFTGAVTDQQGLFRAARGGTLMLDEVAEIPLPLQANLLRVLEMREVRPVGGTHHVATDVRVIATSNRELMQLVQEGRFRADLYSRLAQWTVRLPPLRDRREDIPALTTHLLGRCDAAGRLPTPDLAEALLAHDWPLNVRGLLSILSVAAVSSPEEGPLLLDDEVRRALWSTRSLRADEDEPEAAEPAILHKEDLIKLMERFHGKVAAAARELGVSRPRLYRLLWAQSIQPEQFRVP